MFKLLLTDIVHDYIIDMDIKVQDWLTWLLMIKLLLAYNDWHV